MQYFDKKEIYCARDPTLRQSKVLHAKFTLSCVFFPIFVAVFVDHNELLEWEHTWLCFCKWNPQQMFVAFKHICVCGVQGWVTHRFFCQADRESKESFSPTACITHCKLDWSYHTFSSYISSQLIPCFSLQVTTNYDTKLCLYSVNLYNQM